MASELGGDFDETGLYRDIFEASQEPIFVHDIETGEILRVNEAAAELLGTDRESLVGQTIPNLAPDESEYGRERAEQILSGVRENRRASVEWQVERIDVDVDPALQVAADDLLADIVGNLLTDAVEHTDQAVTISVEARRNGDSVVLTVEDDGTGVQQDSQSDVFARGEKGTESSGSGFGLFFVASMVESYGGDVSVSRSEMGGAEFTLELKLP